MHSSTFSPLATLLAAPAVGATRIAPAASASRPYQVEVQTQVVLGNWASANTVTLRLSQEPLARLAEGGRYTVSMLEFAQTNSLGLHELTADIARLRTHLLVDTDAAGRIMHVANAPDLAAKYVALLPFLHKKYRGSELITPTMLETVGQVLADGDHLARTLADAPEYALLFPDLSGHPFTAQPAPHRARRLPRVLGALDLALQTRAWTVPAPAGVAQVVCVEGRPDPDHYDPNAMREAVRTLTGQYDAAADLQVQHIERYELRADGGLSSAARFTTAAIPGVFFSKTVATLFAAAPTAATPAA